MNKEINWDGISKFATIALDQQEVENCFVKKQSTYKVEGERALRLGFSREIDMDNDKNWQLVESAMDFASNNRVYVHFQDSQGFSIDIISPDE